MIMLAEIPAMSAAPATIASWLECLAWVIGIVLGGIYVLKEVRGKPANEKLHSSQQELTRRIEKLEGGLVGAEWFKSVDAKLLVIQEDVKKDRADHEKHISVRASRIYDEMKSNTEGLRKELQDQGERRVIQIDDLRREVMGRIEETRKELSDNLIAMPNQIVALLKNTDAI